MSFPATIQKAGLDSFRVLTRPASVFVNGVATPLFTIVGGSIRCIAITGIVTVQVAAGANAMVINAPGAVPMDNGAVDVDGSIIGVVFYIPGSAIVVTAIVAAAVYSANMPWQCVPGDFTCTCVADTDPGEIQWNLAYIPLTAETVVVVA